MSKLDDYLITEGRGKKVKQDEALNWIIQNCQQLLKWMKTGRYIARAVSKKDSSMYWLVDPKKSSEPRKSANTYNYYTLIMDNESSWSKYPKRSKSLICLVDGYTSGREDFIVFPKDGWRIGNTNERDFWGVADKIDKRIHTMDEWARMVDILLNFDAVSSLKHYDKTLQQFQSRCKEFDNHVKDYSKTEQYSFIIDTLGKEYTWDDLNHAMAEEYKGDLYKMCKGHIDPNRLGMSLVKSNLSSIPRETEVWTDSECVMINSKQWFNKHEGDILV